MDTDDKRASGAPAPDTAATTEGSQPVNTPPATTASDNSEQPTTLPDHPAFVAQDSSKNKMASLVVTILMVVLVAVFVSWFIWHRGHHLTKPKTTATTSKTTASTSTTPASSTDNASLNQDLQSINNSI